MTTDKSQPTLKRPQADTIGVEINEQTLIRKLELMAKREKKTLEEVALFFIAEVALTECAHETN